MVHAPTRPAHPRPHALTDVVGALHAAGVDADLRDPAHGAVAVTGMTLSTDRVEAGDLYAAVPGARAHGASYVGQALAAGAVAVLTDAAGAALVEPDVPCVIVESPRQVLGEAAAEIYDHPARDLSVVGVTGTQGKTTTTRLLEGALTGAGVAAAVIGTVGTRVLGHEIPTQLTTPEAPDLHGLFAAMREQRVQACAMEVSSHALVLGRVDGVVFDLAVFTNLGRDHLDFHHDVDDYFAAKARLFGPDRARRALVNIDDAHGRRLADDSAIPVVTFSVEGRPADWSAVDLAERAEGSSFVVVAPDGSRIAAGVPLAGRFNVANALAAIAAAGEIGFDPQEVAHAMSSGAGVPGRLERVDGGQDFLVVIDYAHKPDAVEAALSTLRPLTDGRVICVIGAGGDRDRGKRPVMGEIASRLADVVVVTDDNPRSEDPDAIRSEILAGATGPAQVREIGDRREAIRVALGLANPGDIVLVAGKGHETGQEIDGTVHPFDDREVVRFLLGEGSR